MFASFYKSAAVLLVAVGGLASLAATAAEKTAAKNCCDLGLACCSADKACCAASDKLGCCDKGMACCKKDLGCCSTPQSCCAEGKECCEQGKACCGTAKTKNVSLLDAKTPSCCLDKSESATEVVQK